MTNKETGKNNIAIGENAGFYFKDDESNQVCIGNFTEKEIKQGIEYNCAIIGNKVVIKKDVMKFLFGKEWENTIKK